MLSECIEIHDESRRAAQDKLHELCEGLRVQAAELKSRVNKALEEKFPAEDRRLQEALNGLRSKHDSDDVKKVLQKAKAELLVAQTYDVVKSGVNEDTSGFGFSSLCDLKTERKVAFEILERRKLNAFVHRERGPLAFLHTLQRG